MLIVSIHPRAEKELFNIPKKFRDAIIREVESLKKFSHPHQHRQIIKLGGRENRYRLRVGDYRVKMELRDEVVRIYEIKHRQAGY
ncbi:MAG: type II toxin-antitoxin system RelE/ParE family toxin [bacterium]|nr:type II toxin-antitoxin system RelE/ParE family toxin [bacterium]